MHRGKQVLAALVLTVACASAVAGANEASVCSAGPIAIQIDQVFERRDSYTVAGQEYVPFARQFGGMRTITISLRTHGESRLILPITQEGRAVRGAGVMTMEVEDRVRARTKSCTRRNVFVANWTVQGVVSDQCTLDLSVSRDWTQQSSGRVCTVDFFGKFSGTYAPAGGTWQVTVKAEHGASAKHEVGNFAAKDVSTLTVIQAPGP